MALADVERLSASREATEADLAGALATLRRARSRAEREARR